MATSDGNSVRDVLREIRRIICLRLGTGTNVLDGTVDASPHDNVGAREGGGRGADGEAGGVTTDEWGNDGCPIVGVTQVRTI